MIGYIIGAVILLIAGFLLYRYLKVNAQNKQLNAQRYARIGGLIEKFEGGQIPTPEEVRPFAYNIRSREDTHNLLKGHEMLHLFPDELITIEKSAEANLAMWLEFPTELDAVPDELEHVKKVTIPVDDDRPLHYHVFKFRVEEPHWAAKDGWMLGVVGPYFHDSDPYDFPPATFSRLSKLELVSPEEEARWVHDNIAMRR